MPERIMLTLSIVGEFFLCVSTYIIAGAVFHNLLDFAISWVFGMLSLASMAIVVFFIKKELAKEDELINKDGGMVDFIKAYVKTKWQNNCQDKK